MSYAIIDTKTKKTIKDTEGFPCEYQELKTAEMVLERLIKIEGAYTEDEIKIQPR